MKELSEFLKSERLKQGLTLKAVAEQAHVSVSVLQSLEEEQYERIGTPLLIRSFVKAYCSALGVDPLPLLERHEHEILSYDRQDDGIRRYGLWAKKMHSGGRRGMVLLMLLLLLLMAALYGGVWISKIKLRLSGTQGSTGGGVYSQQELPADLREGGTGSQDVSEVRKEPSAASDSMRVHTAEALDGRAEKADAPEVLGKTQDSQVAKLATEGANPAEILVEDKPKPGSQDSRKHRLKLEAMQKTWIQIKIDGKKVQNAMLRTGDKREWEAENNMQIVVGNGGAVTLKWDNQPLNANAKPGRILRLSLPPAAEPARKPSTQ